MGVVGDLVFGILPHMLYLSNTLTRKKEEFSTIKHGLVSLYACGPTVYWFAHMGNMRAFLFVDVLRRTLVYNGFTVKLVMNITDVGHLTDDADEGEDKMLVAMRRDGKSALEIAEAYTQTFLKDSAQLNILPADVYPRATAHIAEQIEMIKQIERNGFAYTTADGVYFDTSKLPRYGVLSRQKAQEKQAGMRVEMKEKKNATDFALWKFSPKDVHREMEWDSPWGKGFPGWHIECSAMSKKYLDFPFDIHTGGIDHLTVHHENELAQSMGCCGVYAARFWMHSEFLTVDGGKMSKSLGNLFTVQNLIEKGFDPLAFRYLVLGAHYGTIMNFTWEALGAAQNALHRLQDIVRAWETPEIGCAEYEERFLASINDDLNTPQALAILWEMVDDPKWATAGKARSLLKFDLVLGLGLDRFVAVPLSLPKQVRDLVAKREGARKEKNWEQSDRLRTQIEALGYLVEDSEAETSVRLKR